MAVTSDSLNFTFLDAINRVLRQNGIIKGDDDAITSFTETQHAATVELARIAIQDELTELIVDKLIPLEKANSTIVTEANTRTYDLASDFIQFYSHPLLYDSSNNRQLYEYPGGEERLRLEIFDYKTQKSDPGWWYFEATSKKRLSFYQVPNVIRTYTYDYERSVLVEIATDEMPLHNSEEAYAFCAIAARRFKFLFENAQNVDSILANDASYQSARSRIVRLLKGKNPSSRYNVIYA